MELSTGSPVEHHVPTLSVVVTSHNYSHFIEACLQSLYAQSRAPDQIVVVDDGSTDATAGLLKGHLSFAKIIHTANGGQAAAFNTGFAASAGDIVIFLDADDVLHPQAVETIFYHWRDDVAAMTFGLETIDADGRSTGLYQSSIRPDRGDIRPQLLASGDFLFPPTSGNAFSRATLARVLPMPIERWRISADCYLIRAAAMVGRFESIPHVLGGYRLHGSNNYALAQDEADMPARRAENIHDIARALADLADNAGILADTGEDAALLAALLRARSEARFAEGAAITATRRPGQYGGGRSIARLAALERAQALLEPRWPPHVPFGSWIEVAGALVPSLDRSGIARAVVTVDPTPRLITVEVSFSDAADDELTLTVDGQFAWRGRPGSDGIAHFSLRAQPWERSRRLRLQLASTQQHARLHAVRIVERVDAAVPYLDDERPRPAWDALESGLSRDQWEAGPGGAAVLRDRHGRLHFFRPEGGDARLMLHFGGLPPAGRLTITCQGDVLFSGRTGSAGAIVVTIPPTREAGNYVPLDLDFEPGTSAGRLSVAVLDLFVEPEGLPSRRLAVLNAGEKIAFGTGGRGALLLDGGFGLSAGGETQTTATEARLRFMLPAGACNMAVVLDMEPLLESLDGFTQALAISLEGETLVSAAVKGAGRLRIDLPTHAAGREVFLVLHTVLVSTGPAAESVVAHAPLLLFGLDFEASVAPPRGGRTAVPAALKPAGRHLIDAARTVLNCEAQMASDRLAETRSALVAWLTGCDDRALLLVAGNGEDLATLADLGAASHHIEHSAGEATALAASAVGSEARRLRHFLIAMLLALPHEVPEAATLAELPAPLFWHSRSFARWLTAAPDIDSSRTQHAYLAYLGRLLVSIDALLAHERTESAGFRLATATLDVLRSTRAMFGDGVMRDIAHARARAIERLLARSGARLAMDRRPSVRRDVLRVAVLVRDVMPNPEGFALLGMYRHLDRARFEPLLVRMDRGANALPVNDIFPQELCLTGLSIAGSVAAIRALDADILVTGSYVTDYEKTSAVLAHRLAPLQLWHAAICPTTGGFSSFDRAISCMASEPADPQRHYREPLAFIDGPLQCAYAFPTLPTFERPHVRKELGVPEGAVMLASGAMAHKISDALLDAWSAILAGAPQAVLVLYPFARNWSMAFAQARFRRRVDRALDAAGVALDRIILLDTQSPERARIIAATADLYLDSFPYTGATTVCEALSAGTPVVTRIGDGLRLLTGASWLRAYGLSTLCAATADDYVATAVDLAKSHRRLAELRREIAGLQKPGPAPHNDQVAFGAAWSATLARVVAESALFPWFRAKPRKAARNRGPAEVAQITPVAPPVARSGRAPVRVAILASPRSGSTLLCDLVNASPGAVCHFEVFHADMIQLRDATARDPVTIAERDADPVGFLDRLSADAAKQGYGLVGFKHFAHLDARITQSVIADSATRIVQIGRANLLAQYSSERIARASGSWFRANGEAWSAPKIRFHATAFERWMHYQRRIEGERMDLLASGKRDALFLDYTGLLDEDLPRRLSDFLGFPIEACHQPNFVRHNDDDILGRFENPETVSAFLAKRGLLAWSRGG